MTAKNDRAAGSDLMMPWGSDIDLAEGSMRNPNKVLVRKASAMRGYYKDEAALERLIAQNDPVHYEVFEKNIPEQYGHLLLCVSKLYPGRVGGECFMTKGHYHTVSGTAEVYLCIRGQGYMMMKTADGPPPLPLSPTAGERGRGEGGKWMVEPMRRHRLVYVPPHWAHRSINTGNEPLISFCVYPAEAGHNYGDIATEGFPKRIFIRAGKEVIE